MKYCIVFILLGISIFLIYFWGKNKKKLQIYTGRESKKESQETKRKKEYIKLKVYRNHRRQIEINCYNMKNEEMGKLLASYTLKGDYRLEQSDYVVHLENIYVGNRFRRRGIGSAMFRYLMQEMLVIEKEEKVSFRYIYGEVGEGGTDDPKKSIPFYKKMDGFSYGEKTIAYQLKNKQEKQEYNQFYYYIR